jgi:AmmeMemoRadiSam system protein B/AmmeMemoRadiSam system protein A
LVGACGKGPLVTGSPSPGPTTDFEASVPPRVRSPASAGSFYPADAAELEAKIHGFLAGVPRVTQTPVRMVLVPHAGLSFSGHMAASAFRQVDPGFTRVVIVAANHNGRARYDGVSFDPSTHYDMPGFRVKVARQNRDLAKWPDFVDVPEAHTMHMIEIELPFLREVNDKHDFEIIPLVVGRLTRPDADAVAASLEKLVDPKTLVVISVDLSHYYPYDRALALDRPCLDAITRMDADDVATCDTDGTQVLLTMTALAARMALTPKLIGYENSGDVTGDKSRVVGYGAVAFEDRFELGPAEQSGLLDLAKRAVAARAKSTTTVQPDPSLLARYPRLRTRRGAFVTLRKNGALRGCIGTLVPTEPLASDVAANAARATSEDPRFSPVQPDELPSLRLSISVLEPARPMPPEPPDQLLQKLGRGHPGVVLSFNGRRSTYLPEVWDEIPEPETFLTTLCRKQGSPSSCWREPAARYETYGSQYFGEPGAK